MVLINRLVDLNCLFSKTVPLPSPFSTVSTMTVQLSSARVILNTENQTFWQNATQRSAGPWRWLSRRSLCISHKPWLSAPVFCSLKFKYTDGSPNYLGRVLSNAISKLGDSDLMLGKSLVVWQQQNKVCSSIHFWLYMRANLVYPESLLSFYTFSSNVDSICHCNSGQFSSLGETQSPSSRWISSCCVIFFDKHAAQLVGFMFILEDTKNFNFRDPCIEIDQSLD